MVKRLRRRPLTAKTGVRVPVGLPKKEHRQSPVFFFWYFRRKRNPQGFARAQRRSTEGAPSGFRSIPRLSLLNLYFLQAKSCVLFLVLPQEAKPAGVRASAATLDRGGPFGVSVDSPPVTVKSVFFYRQSPVFFFWYFRRKRNPQGFARAFMLSPADAFCIALCAF